MSMITVVLCILLSLATASFGGNVPIVQTKLGGISGVFEKSYYGREFAAFYGVPYAKPPVESLRFTEPQPIEPWPGTWNATTNGITCSQLDHIPKPEGGLFIGTEDCLYLNIFSPNQNPLNEKLLDVIVYIHGGAFMFGSNNVGPKYLMDRDVVLVSVNYRLGTLGFLSTEDDVLPGNLGLKDQNMALRWVKDNIETFGGNPNSVTLTGLSAGGASVHFHYFSPLSNGLFHRGISISGTVFGPTKIQENPLEKTKRVAFALGCVQTSTKELVECMKTRPVKQVTEAIKVLRPWLYYPYSPIAATIEHGGANAFLEEHPWALLAKRKFNDLPWLNSVVSDEGLYPGFEFASNPNHLVELNNRWNELAPHVLDYNYTVAPESMDQISQDIRKEYLQDRPITTKTFKDFVSILSDRLFVICAEKASKTQASKAVSDVYNYFFSYAGDLLETESVKHMGVGHGDDKNYIFSDVENPEKVLNQLDAQIKEILLDMWTSFARTNVPKISGIKWMPVSKDPNESLDHLHIRHPDEMFMEDANVVDRHRQFWDDLPILEDDKLFANTNLHEEL